MNIREIEHMWKVASNNPNHDTNWHDPVVEAFAKMVMVHTLSNIDPSSFMSFQEGVEVGRFAERNACAKLCIELAPSIKTMTAYKVLHEASRAIQARGDA